MGPCSQPHPRPPHSPSQTLAGVEKGDMDRRRETSADPRNLTSNAPHPFPPSHSPSWAEVASGGQKRRGQPPPDPSSSTHSTPAPPNSTLPSPPPPFPPPSAHTQFMAWLGCRKAGYPARLVLETNGVDEEISFWFRPGAVKTAAGDAASSRVKGRRKEREQRRRRLRAERRKAARCREVPTPAAGPPARMATVPDSALPAPSPPASSPPAKRLRSRNGRQQALPTPEQGRTAAEGIVAELEVTLGSPTARLDITQGDDSIVSSDSLEVMQEEVEDKEDALRRFLRDWRDNGMEEKVLVEHVKSIGGWNYVDDVIFPPLPPDPMQCRFCKILNRNIGYEYGPGTSTDDHCEKCSWTELITLVKKYAFTNN